jgi:hypothetical protein
VIDDGEIVEIGERTALLADDASMYARLRRLDVEALPV